MDIKILSEKIPKLQNLSKTISSKLRSLARRPASGTTLSCDFGRSKIVLLETLRSESKIKIHKFLMANLLGDTGQSAEQLRKLVEQGNFGSQKVRISVKGQGVITRFIQFPKMKSEEVKSAIQYEVEKYIPFKSSEVVVDYSLINDNVKLASGFAMDLLLVAVKKDELYELVKIFKQAELDVELIDIDSLAAVNALEFFHPEASLSCVGIFDVGTEISNLCVVREGKPRFIRDISFGRIDIAKLLKRKLGLSDEAAWSQLDGEQILSGEALEVIIQGLSNLIAELKISMEYYLDQVQPAAPLLTLFVAGTGAYYAPLTELLIQNLGIPVQPMDILSKVELDPGVDAELIKKNRGSLPLAMGLSLRNR